MPRAKKTPEFEEGPQAFENFRALAARIVGAGKPSIEPRPKATHAPRPTRIAKARKRA